MRIPLSERMMLARHMICTYYLPMNMAVPWLNPTPPTASGRTNMLGPTVFPVTNKEADNTLVTEARLGVSGIIESSIAEYFSASLSVAIDRDVICDFLLSYWFCCCIDFDLLFLDDTRSSILSIVLVDFIDNEEGVNVIILFLFVYCIFLPFWKAPTAVEQIVTAAIAEVVVIVLILYLGFMGTTINNANVVAYQSTIKSAEPF